MTEYRMNCWKKRDLIMDPAPAAPTRPTLTPNDMTLLSPAAPECEILVKGDVSKDGRRNLTVLGEAALLDGKHFPAGSRIVPSERVCASSGHSNGLIVGIIETTTGMQSNPLVFASGNIAPDQRFERADKALPDATTGQTSFVRGTLIETPHGAIPVEQLEDGDEVMTPNGGIQLITGLSRQRYSGLDLALFPSLLPVRIMAGALTCGRPGHDLLVSQEHRLLVDDWRAAYLFGEDEILVPAISLLNDKSVVLEDHRAGVEYFEISVENAGLVNANGLWAETDSDKTEQREVAAEAEVSAIAALPRNSTIALVA